MYQKWATAPAWNVLRLLEIWSHELDVLDDDDMKLEGLWDWNGDPIAERPMSYKNGNPICYGPDTDPCPCCIVCSHCGRDHDVAVCAEVDTSHPPD